MESPSISSGVTTVLPTLSYEMEDVVGPSKDDVSPNVCSALSRQKRMSLIVGSPFSSREYCTVRAKG